MKLKLSFFLSVLALWLMGQAAPAYYNTVDFNRSGNDLKTELTSLVKSTHAYTISYSELKELMKASDVDPQNPANLLLIYGSQSSGKHQRSRSISGSWNREHVYAKSKGTPNLGTAGPGADGHHLRPADISLNSDRGNLLFDDGVGPMAYVTPRGGWYPGDEWKGDVARILMYMYVRYENQCKPLNITLNPATYAADFPDILLKWNVEDPVSDFEIQRNNVVAQKQKNRNPFIDNPYLATAIWGGPAAQNTWPDTLGGGTSGDTEAPSVPASLQVTGVTASSVSLSWTAATDNVGVTGYEVYANGVLKTTVAATTATLSALTPGTQYDLYVRARDAAGNRSAVSNTVTATTETSGTPTPGTTCGTEDFENIPSTGGNPPASSYTDRTWTSNSIVWTATNARTDKQVYIGGDNDKAICLRRGSLTSSVISGGIGTLSVKTYLPFNDSAGSYILKINGVVKGEIPYSKTAKTAVVENINVAGPVVIELIDTATSNRVSFDNLSWTCYETPLAAADPSVRQAAKLTAYPNPVKNGQLQLRGLLKPETVQIYDLTGKVVHTAQQVAQDQLIRLPALPAGIYVIKAGTQTVKIHIK